MATLNWYGPQVTAAIRKESALRVEYAARATRDFLRKMVGQKRVATSARQATRLMKRGIALVSGGSTAGGYPAFRTGWLQKNIQMEMDRAKVEARVGTNVLYGRYLEFGTRLMAARPWLSSGFRELAPAIKRILEAPVGGTI